MLIGVAALVTWMMLGNAHDDRLADPPCHLPAAGGCAAHPVHARDEGEAARRNIRSVWRCSRRSVTFVVSLWIWAGFDTAMPGFQFVEKTEWLGSGISYHMGVDGISMLFVMLTTFLMPLCILASWESVEKRVKEYMIAFLVLETLMIGVFCALDLVLFYVFFEAGPDPDVPDHRHLGRQAPRLCLVQVLPLHAARLGADAARHHGDVLAGRHHRHPTLLTHNFPAKMQTWLWLAFFASFAVKMPMWPVHTWLPDAHVEAPTAGSVILAASC
jgi:NADH-quinone oxidoreductase subunit M